MSKLLGEFLQEQQEPFALEVYLLERGRNFNARYTLCNSAKHFTSSSSIKKRRCVAPNCSDFLKAVFSQLVMANSNQKLNSSGNGGRGNALMGNSKRGQENADEDRFSSAKYGNLFLEEKVEADRKSKRRAEEDSKRLSPISVLEETESDQDSPIHYTVQGESSNSIPQCILKKLTHYSFRDSKELVGSYSCDQYIINKRALQQRKQILIDCVREVIENHRKMDKNREEFKKMLGAEELWKLVCENVWIWSQDSINESNIVHLLHSDLLASEDECNADLEQQKMEISVEVENAILEDVINEIVTL